MKKWKPRIKAIANELVQHIEKCSEVNIVDEFAAPLPVTVISDLLGIPTTDRKKLKLGLIFYLCRIVKKSLMIWMQKREWH